MDKLLQLAEALSHAQEAANELNELDDELSTMIPEYEGALKNLGLGIGFSVELDSGERWSRQLTFDKHNGSWKLLVEEGPDDGDPELWNQTPLASMSRDERASVFAYHLDTLISSAAAQIRKKISSRRATIEQAKARLETLKRMAKP